MKIGYMAIGHYGTTLHLNNPGKSPRKQLLDKLGATHAKKMYIDTKDGTPKHIGYIVNREWFNIYEVHRWEGKSVE
jgi:hypothetical protein